MEKVYSIKELREMDKATRKVAIELIIKGSKDGEWRTAKELAELTGGLFSPRGVAATIVSNDACFRRFMTQKVEDVYYTYNIPCDKDGNPLKAGVVVSVRHKTTKRRYKLC